MARKTPAAELAAKALREKEDPSLVLETEEDLVAAIAAEEAEKKLPSSEENPEKPGMVAGAIAGFIAGITGKKGEAVKTAEPKISEKGEEEVVSDTIEPKPKTTPVVLTPTPPTPSVPSQILLTSEQVKKMIATAIAPFNSEVASLRSELANSKKIAAEVVSTTTEATAEKVVDQLLNEVGFTPLINEVLSLLKGKKEGDTSDQQLIEEVRMHLPVIRNLGKTDLKELIKEERKLRDEIREFVKEVRGDRDAIRRERVETQSAVNALLIALEKDPISVVETSVSTTDEDFEG